jgi:hypothetical protein
MIINYLNIKTNNNIYLIYTTIFFANFLILVKKKMMIKIIHNDEK